MAILEMSLFAHLSETSLFPERPQNVQINARHWTIHRRYSDFEDLHDLIGHYHPLASKALSLPSKRYIKRYAMDQLQLGRNRKQNHAPALCRWAFEALSLVPYCAAYIPQGEV
jgi:hypothetical protein